MKRHYFISLGGAGNAVLDKIVNQSVLIEDNKKQACYINFSSSDLEVKNKNVCIISGEGTGRSKDVGKQLIRENEKSISKFVEEFYSKGPQRETESFNVVVIASMGGGTGSSLTPFIIDELRRYDNKRMNIVLFAIISSPQEGVATLPNSIKTFHEIYNDYVLGDKLKSCFLFDNQKFEKDYEIGTYDFDKMNEVIAGTAFHILDEMKYAESAGGHQTLDINEFMRVLSWGKGLCDISMIDIDKKEDADVKIKSDIFGGAYKYNTAKAVALEFEFMQKMDDIKEGDISFASSLIEKVKKKFGGAFFVFGFSFNNKKYGLEVPYRIKLVINGIGMPKSMETNVKKATKSVQKLKERNESFTISDDADLDF